MRRPPRVIRLLSQRIRVEYGEGLHTEVIHENGEVHTHKVYGVYDERDQTVTLDKDVRGERRRETFLHENLHAMVATGQLDDIINEAIPGGEEHIVSVLAPILFSWLRENPGAVAYLQEVHDEEDA